MIGRYLDLSTAHLPEEEMQQIAAAPPWSVAVHRYGAWVTVNREPEFETDVKHDGDWDEFPNLLAVVRYARTLDDVNWINFDADGDQVEGLPVFDWDEDKED